ncbi:MAG TPA: NAD(P)H-dependent oxidoreductase [Pseudolabrys sp.]|jgi:chromate reductase, NAD(P)H dehydrogenase (quinone)|nr:NAD(P)H-dependent oxidoreductase [Pseudolabrys sp.]
MANPKILVLPGSTRAGSHNVRLAALAAKELTLIDADVTRISLADYPLPIYEADLDARAGQPANAVKLKQMMMAHHGVFIATPEYSASVPPMLKNALDWVSRVRERGDPTYAAFKGRVFAIASASPGKFGGLRAAMALRQVLELGCGALVIPEQVSVSQADHAFDDMDNIADTNTANLLRAQLSRLVEMAQMTM